MQDDSVILPPQGTEQDSKIIRRTSKDWVPLEAKQLFASLIYQVTQDQLDEERAREAKLFDQWANMPSVAREFHQGVDVAASPVGETGSLEVTAVGEDGAVSFRENVQPNG